MEDLLFLVSGISDGIPGEIVKRLMIGNNIKVHKRCEGFDNFANAVFDNISYVTVGMDNQ